MYKRGKQIIQSAPTAARGFIRRYAKRPFRESTDSAPLIRNAALLLLERRPAQELDMNIAPC
jgi:hypothetical protein